MVIFCYRFYNNFYIANGLPFTVVICVDKWNFVIDYWYKNIFYIEL